MGAENETEMQEMPAHLVRRLHQKSVALFSEAMTCEDLSLTPVQFATLQTLRDKPGIDQATVAAEIAYDRATLGKVVERLERRGLIQRTVSPRDRRARELTLTDDGNAILDKALPHIQGIQPLVLAGLNDEEAEVFQTLLRRVIEAHDTDTPMLEPAR